MKLKFAYTYSFLSFLRSFFILGMILLPDTFLVHFTVVNILFSIKDLEWLTRFDYALLLSCCVVGIPIISDLA